MAEGGMVSGQPWTEEQHRLLVECAVHATVITGHPIGECTVELDKLIRAYRQQENDRTSGTEQERGE